MASAHDLSFKNRPFSFKTLKNTVSKPSYSPAKGIYIQTIVKYIEEIAKYI
jgi:hypothetical protein